ncbi:MAG: MBL fold metallo-hydrolase [Clostridium sp.]|uniref:ComEC/Rec2 family competence protein n=1 Tax=Clostridium sp. DSM 8431 TaxID=1761781 RepID=UPI0008E43F6C|nr:ComEC/Rec2 family competence protein [Clostridium sp. DSM 8431]MCR4944335.1 MBL fold metallo-hydrolase [Clostridium sp.]SFU33311.1 DNA internalization-related competence protein ComEC/Rec2 [Clostridium sp. DSM 8431]
MKKGGKLIKITAILTLCFSLIFSLYGCENSSSDFKEELKVHFIDVGQGDCILLQQGEFNMLIDGGDNKSEELIKNYLEKQKIKKLDYVVVTHVHEDHIGSLDYVINYFNIGKVYFPRQTTINKDFQKVLDACSDKNLYINSPKVGEEFKFGKASCTILSPSKENYEDINDSSIVIKVVLGHTSFLLTGDAGKEAEEEMVSNNLDLKADVLKIGHHGSKSGTTDKFLEKVNPKYAVISVEKNDDYSLPSESVMKRLKENDIAVYRTDESGSIVAVSNGSYITFNNVKGSYKGYSEN